MRFLDVATGTPNGAPGEVRDRGEDTGGCPAGAGERLGRTARTASEDRADLLARLLAGAVHRRDQRYR